MRLTGKHGCPRAPRRSDPGERAEAGPVWEGLWAGGGRAQCHLRGWGKEVQHSCPLGWRPYPCGGAQSPQKTLLGSASEVRILPRPQPHLSAIFQQGTENAFPLHGPFNSIERCRRQAPSTGQGSPSAGDSYDARTSAFSAPSPSLRRHMHHRPRGLSKPHSSQDSPGSSPRAEPAPWSPGFSACSRAARGPSLPAAPAFPHTAREQCRAHAAALFCPPRWLL